MSHAAASAAGSLPPVISEYLAASDRGDAEALARCFAEDAVAVDEGREWRGTPAIRRWRATVATSTIAVATAIVNMWTNDAADVAASYRQIAARHGDRFLLGIGIGHPESVTAYRLLSPSDSCQTRLSAGPNALAALQQVDHPGRVGAFAVHHAGHREYLHSISRAQWDEDRVLRDAVLYRLLLLGEIASALPESLRDRYPDVAWRHIRAFRNLAVHRYFVVDWAVV